MCEVTSDMVKRALQRTIAQKPSEKRYPEYRTNVINLQVNHRGEKYDISIPIAKVNAAFARALKEECRRYAG